MGPNWSIRRGSIRVMDRYLLNLCREGEEGHITWEPTGQ